MQDEVIMIFLIVCSVSDSDALVGLTEMYLLSEIPVLGFPSLPRGSVESKCYVGLFIRYTVIFHLRIM